jgi:hypothetical protein
MSERSMCDACLYEERDLTEGDSQGYTVKLYEHKRAATILNLIGVLNFIDSSGRKVDLCEDHRRELINVFCEVAKHDK